MSINRFFSRVARGIDSVEQLYQAVCDGSEKEVTTEDLINIFSYKLNVLPKELENSAMLANLILQNISSKKEVTGQVEWGVVQNDTHPTKRFFVRFNSFSCDELKRISGLLNDKYKNINLEVSDERFAYSAFHEELTRLRISDLPKERARYYKIIIDFETFGQDKIVSTKPDIYFDIQKFCKHILPDLGKEFTPTLGC